MTELLTCLLHPNLKKRFRLDFELCDSFSFTVDELSSFGLLLPPKMLARLLSRPCRLVPLALLTLDLGIIGAFGMVSSGTFDWPEFAYPIVGSRSPNR